MKTIEKIISITIVAISTIIANGHAQTTTWTLDPADGEGNWFTTGSPPVFITHWNNGEPTASTDAIIANGGTAFLSTQQAHAKRVLLGSDSFISEGGSLRIGAVGSTAAPGILDTPEVHGGIGDSRLIFSHNDNSGNYHFTRNGTALGGIIAITGSTNVFSQGGTTTLVGNNTYTGTTFLNGGVLAISDNQSLGAASNPLVFNSGILRTVGDSVIDITRTATLGATGGTIDVTNSIVAYKGEIGGSGRLRVQGSGTLVLSGDNAYSGGTQISGGTVFVNNNENLGATSGGLLFNNGGTLGVLDNFATGRTVTLNNGGGVFNIFSDKALVLSNVISGIGQLTKRGSGTLSIVANTTSNTYTGGTSIEGGRVVIFGSGNNTAFGTGPVTVQTVGALSGQGRIAGNVTVAGELSPSGLLGSPDGLFNLQAGLTVTGTGTVQMTIGPAGGGGTWIRGVDYDAIDVAGTFLLNTGATLGIQLVGGYSPAIGDTFDLFNFNPAQFTGTFAFNTDLGNGLQWDITNLYTDGIITVAAIPEPSTWFLLLGAAGVIACGAAAQKRSKIRDLLAFVIKSPSSIGVYSIE